MFFILNWQSAVFGREEGLLYIKNSVLEDKETVSEVLPLVEDDAIVISERFDKYFWPPHQSNLGAGQAGRRVIVGDLVDNKMNIRYAKLVNHVPVYYFGFIFPPEDMEYLNNRKLAEAGLQIKEVKLLPEKRMGLYKLNKKISY